MRRINEIYCRQWFDSLPDVAADEETRVASGTLRRYLVNHLILNGIDFAKLVIVICLPENEIIAIRPFTCELFSTSYIETAELVPTIEAGVTRYFLQLNSNR